MSMYDSGILMTSGFSIASQKPADLKYLADTIQDRDDYVTNNLAYEGMLVYVSETEKTYQYKKNNTWEEFGFNTEKFQNNIYDGLDSDSTTLALSAKQGKVLDEKITNHISSSVHITEEEREKWNNIIDSIKVSTQTEAGLMSANDKAKLDGIESGANNYIHPDDENTRHVTDEQIAHWNDKASVDLVTHEEDGLMSKEDKIKLDTVEENANYYIHPDTHPATMIVEDSTHRFVTDEEKTYWNNKASTSLATQTSAGLMSANDKAKLDALTSGGDVSEEQLASMSSRLTIIEEKLKYAVYYASDDDTGLSDLTVTAISEDDTTTTTSTSSELDDILLRLEAAEAKLQNVVYFE